MSNSSALALRMPHLQCATISTVEFKEWTRQGRSPNRISLVSGILQS
jgi:hypothetical protein